MLTREALLIETLFRVVTKNGDEVDFILNDTQRRIDENLTGRDLIPKARQPGVSTYFLARYTAACLSRRNTKAVIISHEAEATQKLLDRAKFFLRTIRGPEPVIGSMSMNSITFPEMNSMMYIGTAGSKTFGRGDTISHLHCSEYAYWPDPKRMLAGLLQAVPMSGEVAIESTGNGIGNDYYRRCMRAASGSSNWKLHFIEWQSIPEYSLSLDAGSRKRLMSSLRDEWEEPELVGILSPEQLAWRRMKLDELDFDLQAFKQEYPMSLEECFQATGRSMFQKVLYVPRFPGWIPVDQYSKKHQSHPIGRHTYSVGADVALGVQGDYSVVEVVCLDTMEQVYEYASNRIHPDDFGDIVADVAAYYNNAYITVESNNHGLVTLDRLLELYDPSLIFASGGAGGGGGLPDESRDLSNVGFRTNMRSKPLLIGKLRYHLARDLTVYSDLLKSELDTFIESETGQLEADEGCHDDRVIALACAVWGLNQAGLFAGPHNDEFDAATHRRTLDNFHYSITLENVLESLGQREEGTLFNTQHLPPYH